MSQPQLIPKREREEVCERSFQMIQYDMMLIHRVNSLKKTLHLQQAHNPIEPVKIFISIIDVSNPTIGS